MVGGERVELCRQREWGLNLTWSHLPVLKLQASYLTSLSLSSLICNTRQTRSNSWGYWAGITAPTTQGYHEAAGVKGQGCTGIDAELNYQPFFFIRSHLPAGPWAEGFGCYVISFLTNWGRYYYSSHLWVREQWPSQCSLWSLWAWDLSFFVKRKISAC